MKTAGTSVFIAAAFLVAASASAQGSVRDLPSEGILDLDAHKSFFRMGQLYGVHDPSQQREGRFHFLTREWHEEDGRVFMVESTEKFTLSEVSSVFGIQQHLKTKLAVLHAEGEWLEDRQEFLWRSREEGGDYLTFKEEKWISTLPTLRVEEGDVAVSTRSSRPKDLPGYQTSSTMRCEYTEEQHFEVKCHYSYLPSGGRSVIYYWRVDPAVS